MPTSSINKIMRLLDKLLTTKKISYDNSFRFFAKFELNTHQKAQSCQCINNINTTLPRVKELLTTMEECSPSSLTYLRSCKELLLCTQKLCANLNDMPKVFYGHGHGYHQAENMLKEINTFIFNFAKNYKTSPLVSKQEHAEIRWELSLLTDQLTERTQQSNFPYL